MTWACQEASLLAAADPDNRALSAATSILAQRGGRLYRCDPEVLWVGLPAAPRSHEHLLLDLDWSAPSASHTTDVHVTTGRIPAPPPQAHARP